MVVVVLSLNGLIRWKRGERAEHLFAESLSVTAEILLGGVRCPLARIRTDDDDDDGDEKSDVVII